jgi:uncharacterized protein YqeY
VRIGGTQKSVNSKLELPLPLSDADSIAVIRKQVKQRQDLIESFEKGGTDRAGGKRESGGRGAESVTSSRR